MIAGAMPEPRARVVEVIKLVPPQDVPYIAARVAERLGMPLERVRKLIDDRTGPITKPLRPDKADAIAQTFEAAGVVVAIRPATEEDDLQYAPRSPAPDSPEPAATAPDAEPAPGAGVTAPPPPAPPAPGEPPPAETAPSVSATAEDHESVEHETAEPETAEPETAEPETVEHETAEPETAEHETAEEEGTEHQTASRAEPEPGAAPGDAELGSDAPAPAGPEAEDSAEAAAVGAALSDAPAPGVRSASGVPAGWAEAEPQAPVPAEPGAVDEPEERRDVGEPQELELEERDEPEEPDEPQDPEIDETEEPREPELDEPEEPRGSHEVAEPEESYEFDGPGEPVGLGEPEGSDELDETWESDEVAEPEESYEFAGPEQDREAPVASEEERVASQEEPVASDEEPAVGAAVDAGAHGTVIVVPDEDNGPIVEHAGLVPSEAEIVPPPGLLLEPVDELDETNDPGPFGIAARGEVVMALPHAASDVGVAADDEYRTEHEDVGEAAPADDGGDAEPHPGGEAEALDAQRSARPFGDPSTWQAGEEAAGWRIGPRAGRRLEVVKEEATLAELPEAAPPAADEALDAAVDEASDEVADENEANEATLAGSDHAPTVAERTRAVFPPRPRGPGPPEGVDERRAVPGVGRASRIPRPPAAASGDPPDAGRSAVGDDGGAAAGRAVPTAWRGLGGEERGPARPPDARLPRREPVPDGEETDEHREPILSRRRVLLLAVLAIALILFFFVQVWAAGRAAPNFEAGLHRFRDADFAAAQRVWSQLASAGDANAQFMLGYLSEAGLGRSWSARAAASWYRLAADAGHAEAQWRLANLYARGLGVPHEPSAAERWWLAATEAGHAEAAFSLGRSRLEGAADRSDAASALAAFERAAVLGWPAAAPYRDALLTAVSVQPHAGALP
jgi:hypothetical protein